MRSRTWWASTLSSSSQQLKLYNRRWRYSIHSLKIWSSSIQPYSISRPVNLITTGIRGTRSLQFTCKSQNNSKIRLHSFHFRREYSYITQWSALASISDLSQCLPSGHHFKTNIHTMTDKPPFAGPVRSCEVDIKRDTQLVKINTHIGEFDTIFKSIFHMGSKINLKTSWILSKT